MSTLCQFPQADPEEDSEINALRDQNSRLKDVIKQMSSDIENIAAQNRTQVSS